jgi:hypothetical protein
MNDETVMKRSGNPKLIECWTFLIYIFLHQKRKQCLEFALPKPGEICKNLAVTIQVVMPVGCTILLLSAETKQGKSIQGGESFYEKMSQKSSALSIIFEGGEGPLQIEFANICRQKTTTSLWNLDRKGNWRKKENLWPLAPNAKE